MRSTAEPVTLTAEAATDHRIWRVIGDGSPSRDPLVLPAGAAAAPGQVSLHGLPAFSNGPQVLVTWDPAAFTPASVGRQYRLTVQDLTVPGLSSRIVPAAGRRRP